MRNVPQKQEEFKHGNKENPALVPLSEAARMLSVGERSVRRLLQTGELPSMIKLGHSEKSFVEGYENRFFTDDSEKAKSVFHGTNTVSFEGVTI